MSKNLLPILFALGTALFWGSYGPTIGNAQAPRINGIAAWSPFKPYVFIGVAYLVVGIVGGLLMMKLRGDTFSYAGAQFPTMKWGFLAGLLGAFGALCLTSAMMTSRGNALLVMPIVFGGAVSVTALVTVLRLHEGTKVSPLLWGGMLLTVLGIVIVASNTPAHQAPEPSASGHVDQTPASMASASEIPSPAARGDVP